MARIHYNVTARQRYETVPKLDPVTGEQIVVPVTTRSGEPKLTKSGRAITRRLTVSDRSQPLPPHTCGHCREPIEIGTKYKWVSIRSGPYGGRTLRRHQTCPTWRQSELTTSKLAGIYAAQEEFQDFLNGDWDDADTVRDALAAAAEQIRDVAEEYRESASNIEEGFGHPTYQSEELEDRANELDDWANEVESADVPEPPDPADYPTEEDDVTVTHDDAMEVWRDEVRDATEIIEEMPL